MTPEGKVKDAIKKAFADNGIAPAGREAPAEGCNGWYFMPVSNGMGVMGIPDFIACVRGTFIAIEAKADETKKPTPLQLRNLSAIVKGGGLGLVIHKNNIEGLRHLLARRMT